MFTIYYNYDEEVLSILKTTKERLDIYIHIEHTSHVKEARKRTFLDVLEQLKNTHIKTKKLEETMLNAFFFDQTIKIEKNIYGFGFAFKINDIIIAPNQETGWEEEGQIYEESYDFSFSFKNKLKENSSLVLPVTKENYKDFSDNELANLNMIVNIIMRELRTNGKEIISKFFP